MIDLHCHTNISDNSFTTEEVIRLAKQQGVTHLAITDHDTTVGLEEAIQIGEEQGVEIIPGIEISAFDYDRGVRAHILGLYVTPGHKALERLCAPLREKRQQTSYEMVKRLTEAGYLITWEEVEKYAEGGTGVYKQHIMHALLEKGYTETIYGDLYKQLFSRGGEGVEPGIAFVPLQYIDAVDAIRAIQKAGGVAVLAHPGQFNNFDAVPEWLEAGLGGIEVKHPLHSEEDMAKAAALAKQFHLVQTGGSDFHGFYGDAGSTIGMITVGIESLEQLKELKEASKVR